MATKKTAPQANLEALADRVGNLEHELKQERRRYDQLLEIFLHIVRSGIVSRQTPGLTEGLSTLIPRQEAGVAERFFAQPFGGAHPGPPVAPATILSRDAVERKVVSVVMILAMPDAVSPTSSFSEDDLGWDGPRKRSAFVPIDRLMREDGVRISGIGPSDFEDLEDVPAMVNLVHSNQAPV